MIAGCLFPLIAGVVPAALLILENGLASGASGFAAVTSGLIVVAGLRVACGKLGAMRSAQMRRIEPFFSLSHGVPTVDDRRVVSGIIYVIKHGLMWRDAPKDYGPHKTVYNRFIRWSRLGVFNRIFAELAGKAGKS